MNILKIPRFVPHPTAIPRVSYHKVKETFLQQVQN